MNAFFLVIYIYAGPLAETDSVALTSIPQPSMAVCQESGKESLRLVQGSTKIARFVCIRGNK